MIPDPEKLAALSEAMTVADDVIRLLVIDELKAEVIPELEQKEATAAADLRDAISALGKPEQALAELERDIAQAEGECTRFADGIASDSISARIAARAAFTEWSAELDTLIQKRDQMERDIAPLRAARDQAQARLSAATDEREAAEFNVSDPRYAYAGFGKKTGAFSYWLMFGHFVPLLLSGKQGHYLHGEAMSYLDHVCLVSGYRTDKLPKDAETQRKYWESVYSDANPPQAAPSGAEVIALAHAEGAASAQVAREQDRLARTITEDHSQPDPWKEYQRLSEIRT